MITLFAPNTPTHDGAVVIQGDRIAACGSLFPLSQNPALARTLGTRHRAAIGLTEETDAVCIVISEETGAISVAVYGKLTRDLEGDALRRLLSSLFENKETKIPFRQFFEKNLKAVRAKGS